MTFKIPLTHIVKLVISIPFSIIGLSNAFSTPLWKRWVWCGLMVSHTARAHSWKRLITIRTIEMFSESFSWLPILWISTYLRTNIKWISCIHIRIKSKTYYFSIEKGLWYYTILRQRRIHIIRYGIMPERKYFCRLNNSLVCLCFTEAKLLSLRKTPNCGGSNIH